MTVTKRHLKALIDQMSDMDVVYVDNGIDSVECIGITVIREESDYQGISTQTDGSPVPVGSLVLRAAN